VFHRWGDQLGPEIEVWAVRLPGRETRLREKPLSRFASLVPLLESEIGPHLRPPYFFFGYSLGALAAFAFAQRLQERGGHGPAGLIVAGARAPDCPPRESNFGALSDADFIREIGTRYNGIAPAVLAQPELLELSLPTLRADIQLSEDYRYTPGAPLSCPLAAFGGTRDPTVTTADLAAWRRHGSGAFHSRLFDGDHFFLQGAEAELLSAIRAFTLSPEGRPSSDAG
jgi:medium-chain acyl-[acyl-carrier-protein] hydrolase